MGEISVAIPTRNRPADLAACLRSLAVQTRQPDRVIVIDASDDDETRRVVEDTAGSKIPHWCYRRAWHASLPAQRNQAIDMLLGSSDIVVFLDDDVILDPSYLAVIEEFMGAQPMQTAGGVQGVSDQSTVPRITAFRSQIGAWLNRAIFRAFGLPREDNRQVVLSSGSYLFLAKRPSQVHQVEYLAGYNMCFPVAVFKEGLRFDEAYALLGGWAYMEDVDFSYRVGNRLGRKNFVLANALIEHRHSSVARLDEFQHYKLRIVNRFRFWKDNINPTPRALLAFIWSNVGWFVWGLRFFIRTGKLQVCGAVVAGWSHILSMHRISQGARG